MKFRGVFISLSFWVTSILHAEDTLLFVDFNQLQGNYDVEISAAQNQAKKLGLKFKAVGSETELKSFLSSHPGKIKAFIISGHCSGAMFLQNGSCKTGISRRSLGELAEKYPGTLGEAETVMGLGCYSLNETNVSSWKSSFPKLTNIGGFCAKGPIGQSSADFIDKFFSQLENLSTKNETPISDTKFGDIVEFLKTDRRKNSMNISIASFGNPDSKTPFAVYGDFNTEHTERERDKRVQHIDQKSIMERCIQSAEKITSFLNSIQKSPDLPFKGPPIPYPMEVALRHLALPLDSDPILLKRSNTKPDSFIEIYTEVDFSTPQVIPKTKGADNIDIRSNIYTPMQILSGCPLEFFNTPQAAVLGFRNSEDVDLSSHLLITLMHQSDVQRLANYCMQNFVTQLKDLAVRCGWPVIPSYISHNSEREELKAFYNILSSPFQNFGQGTAEVLGNARAKVAKIINPTNEQFTFFSIEASFLKSNASERSIACTMAGIGFEREAKAIEEANKNSVCTIKSLYQESIFRPTGVEDNKSKVGSPH